MTEDMFGESQSLIFHQDGASLHPSVFTSSWLSSNGVRNIWGVMACRVYNIGGQFDNVDHLKEAVLRRRAIFGPSLHLKLVSQYSEALVRCC